MTSGKSGVYSSATKIACQWLPRSQKRRGSNLRWSGTCEADACFPDVPSSAEGAYSSEDETKETETRERHYDYETDYLRGLCRNGFGRWQRVRRSLQRRQGRWLRAHARLHRSNDGHSLGKNRSASADRNDEPRGRRKGHILAGCPKAAAGPAHGRPTGPGRQAFDPDGRPRLLNAASNATGADWRLAYSRADASDAGKKKGLQLALEPLNGRGIAGYVPKP